MFFGISSLVDPSRCKFVVKTRRRDGRRKPVLVTLPGPAGCSTMFEEFGAVPVGTTATIEIIPVDTVICCFELGAQSSFDFLS